MKSNKFMRIASIVLSLCMVVSMTALSSVSASAITKAEQAKNHVSRLKNFDVDADKTVTAIITVSGDAQIDLDLKGAPEKSVRNARHKAQTRQQALLGRMSNSFDYDLVSTYSTLFNGVAVSTKFSNLEKIEDMEYVTGVYLANTYGVPDYSVVPMTEYSGRMIGADTIHDFGYDGDGTVIAVLDTGLNINHVAFQDYGKCEEAPLTKAIVEGTNTTKRGTYVSQKVPFSYDYADDDKDVADKDGHGTHVAGIAAGYAQASDGAVEFMGQAPGAQILAMKIFKSEQPGTDSSIYISALEDAYLLGADVVNMSIGATNGFTYDSELEDEVYGNIYKKLDKSGVIMCVSAGNEYSMAYKNYSPIENTVPASYTDYGSVASPSTYPNNISIASIENTNMMIYPINVGDKVFDYIDSSESKKMWRDAFGGKELKYVLIDGVGEMEDYDDAKYRVSEGEDWIAVVSRGDITFEEKLENAYDAGAAGMICYNNQDGEISMQIESFEIPGISITQENGNILKANAEDKVGMLTVGKDYVPIKNKDSYNMSDFSCWGTTSDLAFKPQLTSPGGDIFSADANTNDGYIVYSGTSMAAPNAAGLFACILEMLRDDSKGDYDKAEISELAKNLAFCTSDIVMENEQKGLPYSPRKQGAGLINAYNMMYASAVIENSEIALKGSKDGVFEISFSIRGLNAETNETFRIVPTVFTDNTIVDTEADTDIYYSDLTAFDLLEGEFAKCSFPSTITVTGTDRVTVSGTVKLTEDGKAVLSDAFENGFFVEGFIKLLSTGDTSDLHATYMGYCGDWNKAPIFDSLDYTDMIDYTYTVNTTVIDSEGQTYADYGYSAYDMIYGECVTLPTEAYLYSSSLKQALGYVGDNYFDYFKYEDGSNAFSSYASLWGVADYIIIYPSLIRNAAHLIMVVSNADTGEVYYVDDTPYARKNVYDNDNEAYINSTMFLWDGMNTYDENSETYKKFIDSNTKINFDFYSWLDYDKDTQAKFEALEGDYTKLLTSDWDSKNVYSISALLDNDSPVVESIKYNKDAKTLDVTFKDNHKMQMVGVMDSVDTDGKYVAQDIISTKPGTSYSTTFDISECVDNGVLYMEACDYAMNWPTQEIYIENDKLVIKSYLVMAFDDEGKEDENANITLVGKDGTVYKNGDGLEVGDYKVLLDGEETGTVLTVDYFGANFAAIGDSLQDVTLNVVHGEDAYTPSGKLTLKGEDTEAEFTVDVATDEETGKEKEVEGQYVTSVLPGEYVVCVDGVETGLKVTVAEDSRNTFTLEYFTVKYHSNTKEYLGKAPETMYLFKGANFTVEENPFTRNDGVKFLNWNTAKNDRSTVYKPGDIFENLSKDIVLYAIWEDTNRVIDTDEDDLMLGDVNCDGDVNMEDVTTLQKVIAELTKFESLGEKAEANADVTREGKTNMEDVVLIQKFIAQLIEKF
ncbi:MAG: S8 family serine peptidase [Clostridiales bacterium]|nr:S8 family serine peptidase [Clostridiales bacterium]